MYQDSPQCFTELIVWHKARILEVDIQELVKTFPADEKYRLVDQLIRSSRSINGNTAEGHGRFTFKDQLRFCIQARGSLSETHNHIFDSLDSGYINKEKYKILKSNIEEVGRLLSGYIKFLRKKQANFRTYSTN